MRLPVFDTKGKRTQEILEFDEKIFGPRVYKVALKTAVLMYEARQRQGTHSTKTRKDCAGSGRKLWRQKGTGRARVGPARAPHWRGGGVVFGPHPRDYSYSIPKKEKLVALNSAWLSRFLDKHIMVIDGFDLDKTPKTAKVFDVLNEMGLNNLRILVGLSEKDEILQKSLRNIPKVSFESISRFNPYILLANDRIVLLKKSFESLVKGKGGEIKSLSRTNLYQNS